MKKWLIAFIVALIASFSISYGFDGSSATSEAKTAGDVICCSINQLGEYYGKSCTKVDQITYQNECENHYCKVVGDIYYDRAGNPTSKINFRKECPDVQIDNNLVETNQEIQDNLTAWALTTGIRVAISLTLYE